MTHLYTNQALVMSDNKIKKLSVANDLYQAKLTEESFIFILLSQNSSMMKNSHDDYDDVESQHLYGGIHVYLFQTHIHGTFMVSNKLQLKS